VTATAIAAANPFQVSLRRHLRAGLIAVLALAGIIFGWGMWTQISGAVIAPGKLVVDSNVKKVQHPTGGVVGDLRVKDGDHVKQGEIVARLDETQARTNLAIVVKALDELAARQARNEAERDGADKVTFPAELTSRANDPEVAQIMKSEQKLFEIRLAAREGQKSQLLEQIAQLREQIQGNLEQQNAKTKEIDWITQELNGVRGLWEKNLVPFNRVTQLERDGARLSGERGALIAQIAQARGRIAETQLKILQIDEDLRTEVGKDLADIRGKKAELVEKRVAAEDQLKRIDLLAPQDGKVFQRSVHTVGGVIQAGEVVMLIVPDADALTVEAKVLPQDIDQVHLGQRATVRFSSFNHRTTPELNGEVVEIGADVTQDDKHNENYYSVRISIPDRELARLGGLKPMAGMPVETFIETSPRTVMSYLLQPVREQIEKTFRGR
jgi:HlyD family secretion protein